jgi:hypothetical protein
MAGSSQIRLTVSALPCTLIHQLYPVQIIVDVFGPAHTLNTPGGIPARSHSSAMIMVAPGSRSEGFTTSVLP